MKKILFLIIMAVIASCSGECNNSRCEYLCGITETTCNGKTYNGYVNAYVVEKGFDWKDATCCCRCYHGPDDKGNRQLPSALCETSWDLELTDRGCYPEK